jgi:choline dehydrogenase
VEWHDAGVAHDATATREVILAAGALQTPQLLQLSGVGPADLLRRHAIPVVADLPGVGENLQDHYQARTILRMRERISLNDDVRNPFKLAAMGLAWLRDRAGPLTVGAGQVGGAACTPDAIGGRPDVQFNVMPLSVDKPGTPLHRYSCFTAAVWQCHPESRGRVAITSSDPRAAPRIETNYLGTERDRRAIVGGLRWLHEIQSCSPLRELVDGEVLPGPEMRDDRALLDFARSTGGTVFHCVGTCRMGTDADAVVTPDLRVRGVEGLRVIDASVMPTITSGNTNAPVMMIAEKGSAMILEDARGR